MERIAELTKFAPNLDEVSSSLRRFHLREIADKSSEIVRNRVEGEGEVGSDGEFERQRLASVMCWCAALTAHLLPGTPTGPRVDTG